MRKVMRAGRPGQDARHRRADARGALSRRLRKRSQHRLSSLRNAHGRPPADGREDKVSVRLRLTRVGGKKDPIWRVVVADQRSPRDGRVIETIGHYNAQTDPSTIVHRRGARAQLARARRAADGHGAQAAAHPGHRVARQLARRLADEPPAMAMNDRSTAPAKSKSCSSTSPKGSSTSPRRSRSSSSRRTTARSCSSFASASDDYGRVIGRGGRTAQALRTVVKAAATSEGCRVLVDIVD